MKLPSLTLALAGTLSLVTAVPSAEAGFGSLVNRLKRASKGKESSVPLPSAVKDADYVENGAFPADKVQLGKFLFFDKILSGNQNISCATCHHPLAGTGDGLSLSVGEGGLGLGMTRMTGAEDERIHERVPRNAPPLFNLGAREFKRIFHDGRVEVDPNEPSGFVNPQGDDLPLGLENIVAVQAMFPPTSGAEMAGQEGENPVADAAAAGNLSGPGGVWDLLAKRLQANDVYVEWFASVYADVNVPEDITMVHAANAIGAYEIDAWRADQSPFDRYLRGDKDAMTRSAEKGMRLFYGKANCASCHSGKFQTDNDFHAICMPQIGPGKGDGPSGMEDLGRGRETLRAEDNYRFRTPSLRNVALTAPYGHAGAFNSLEAVVRHHLSPQDSMMNYDFERNTALPSDDKLDHLDQQAMQDPEIVEKIVRANTLKGVSLSDTEFRQLMDFLHALTDTRHIDMRADIPEAVPSGLPVFD